MTRYSTAIPRISGTEDASVSRGRSRLAGRWRLSNWHPHVCTVSPPNWWFYCDSRCHDAAPGTKRGWKHKKKRRRHQRMMMVGGGEVGRLFWLCSYSFLTDVESLRFGWLLPHFHEWIRKFEALKVEMNSRETSLPGARGVERRPR